MSVCKIVDYASEAYTSAWAGSFAEMTRVGNSAMWCVWGAVYIKTDDDDDLARLAGMVNRLMANPTAEVTLDASGSTAIQRAAVMSASGSQESACDIERRAALLVFKASVPVDSGHQQGEEAGVSDTAGRMLQAVGSMVLAAAGCSGRNACVDTDHMQVVDKRVHKRVALRSADGRFNTEYVYVTGRTQAITSIRAYFDTANMRQSLLVWYTLLLECDEFGMPREGTVLNVCEDGNPMAISMQSVQRVLAKLVSTDSLTSAPGAHYEVFAARSNSLVDKANQMYSFSDATFDAYVEEKALETLDAMVGVYKAVFE